jgi:hypothetical protein
MNLSCFHKAFKLKRNPSCHLTGTFVEFVVLRIFNIDTYNTHTNSLVYCLRSNRIQQCFGDYIVHSCQQYCCELLQNCHPLPRVTWPSETLPSHRAPVQCTLHQSQSGRFVCVLQVSYAHSVVMWHMGKRGLFYGFMKNSELHKWDTFNQDISKLWAMLTLSAW